MKRLFIASKINVNSNIIDTYNQLSNLLQYDSIRWCSYTNLHLTFKFLGNTKTELIPSLKEIITLVNNEFIPTELVIKGLGLFGSRYSPKVIWLGFNDSNNLIKDIHLNLVEKLKSINIFPDRQNFVPHLTLARINHVRDKRVLSEYINKHKDTEFMQFRFENISLYESILKKGQKPRYINLH